MKKLITMTLCFLLAATIFSGCRGNVNDDGKDMSGRDRQYVEPSTHMTVPSMPSQPTMEHTLPSDSYSEPTQESSISNGDATTPSGR